MTNSNSYYSENFSPDIQAGLEAGAFRALCQHLHERSDEVQNIDLMTVSGFCRNCLSKWLVLSARQLSSYMKQSQLSPKEEHIVQKLDSFGYDEAAETIYGCKYSDWKNKHAKKASTEIMEKYNASKAIHAQHDADLVSIATQNQQVNTELKSEKVGEDDSSDNKKMSSIVSAVCCQDVDNINTPVEEPSSRLFSHQIQKKNSIDFSTKMKNQFNFCDPPKGDLDLFVGIITISDRASMNQYTSGDLSGAAVADCILENLAKLNKEKYLNGDKGKIISTFHSRTIIPDEREEIEHMLLRWCGKTKDKLKNEDGAPMNIIFTTGGTGFSYRDVTPEATRNVLDRECKGIMQWISSECSRVQPMAALSRATAGICGATLVINLPGTPRGVQEILDRSLSLILHVMKDL